MPMHIRTSFVRQCFISLIAGLIFDQNLVFAASGQPKNPTDSKAQSISVSALLELAVAKSFELKAIQIESQGQKLVAESAARWENPQLEIGGERKDQPVGQTDFTKIGLSQFIPWPGRLDARSKAAEARSQVRAIEAEQAEALLRAEVLVRLYEYQVAREKAAHAEERLERFKTVNTYLKARVFASPQKQAESTIVRAKLFVLSREFRMLEAARLVDWNRLNLYLGLIAEPTIDSPWHRKAEDVNPNLIVEKALQSGFAARIQAARVREAESESLFANSETWPGFTLSANYANGTGADPEKILGLGLSFPIPVFNPNRGTARGALAHATAEREKLNFYVQQVSQDAQSAVDQYNSAKRSVEELSIDDIPKIEKDMSTIDVGFKRGQVDLLTYLEADSQHFESISAILESQIDLVKCTARLKTLTGSSRFSLEN